MGTFSKREGQTLIETAFVLFLLLLILLGITEFSRAWYTKNSLKNAARQGARVAAVTPVGSFPSENPFTCDTSTTCANPNAIINAVCCQPGIPKQDSGTSVTLICKDLSGTKACSDVTSGDEIEVSTSSTFTFIIGNSPWPWSKSMDFTTNASMRYEG